MIVRTKLKMLLAGLLQRGVMAARRLAGLGPVLECRRGGITWRIDLAEGIDFSIFFLGAFEPMTVGAYRRLVSPGATVVDIGANIGAHTLPLAAQVGDSGRVIAVEPTRYAFDRLIANLALNPALERRVTAVQAMLLADSKRAVVAAIPSSWPLHGGDGAHPEHGGIAKSTGGARAVSLDELSDSLDLMRIDFIKLDVDGYELEVLRGAERTLARFAPVILFEHSPYVLVEKGHDPDEMIAILRRAGYRFHQFFGGRVGAGSETLPAIPIGASLNLLAIRPTPRTLTSPAAAQRRPGKRQRQSRMTNGRQQPE